MYKWLAEHAGLLVRRNINQQWVNTHTELQLLRGVIVFQTLADFAYIYINTADGGLRDMIRSGMDELLMHYCVRDAACDAYNPESDTETETSVTDTTAATDLTTEGLKTPAQRSRNGYIYTFV